MRNPGATQSFRQGTCSAVVDGASACRRPSQHAETWGPPGTDSGALLSPSGQQQGRGEREVPWQGAAKTFAAVTVPTKSRTARYLVTVLVAAPGASDAQPLQQGASQAGFFAKVPPLQLIEQA